MNSLTYWTYFMELQFYDSFFEHLKREGTLVAEVASPRPNCRRWIEISVHRQYSAETLDEFVSPLNRLAVGPFHWRMTVFDFNHIEHSLDDIEDPEDETGMLYRKLVIEVTTTDIEMYKEVLITYAGNEHVFGGGKNHLDFPC